MARVVHQEGYGEFIQLLFKTVLNRKNILECTYQWECRPKPRGEWATTAEEGQGLFCKKYQLESYEKITKATAYPEIHYKWNYEIS